MTLRVAAAVTAIAAVALAQSPSAPELESLPYAPRHLVCYRAASAPLIDGRLDDEAWGRAAWSEPFIDIEGRRRPAPRFTTRVKMLWDADYLYIGGDMEEPDVWATLTERDSVIFQDNDFEVFIDPDGDTHNYYELEINALGTVWDLMLVRPYRDGGPPINAWDIAGLRSAVHVRGTLNRPADRDAGWSVELALPWKVLAEAAPGKQKPLPGDRWRINFSRVEWQIDRSGVGYRRLTDPSTGALLSESNWVWSPQGAVAMHMPERWGVVQFAETAPARFVEDPNDRVRWALRRLYYRQRDVRERTGRYASDLAALDPSSITVDGIRFAPALSGTPSMYEIIAPGAGGTTVHIAQDGRTWVTR